LSWRLSLFTGPALIFVYRSFYCMRIPEESAVKK